MAGLSKIVVIQFSVCAQLSTFGDINFSIDFLSASTGLPKNLKNRIILFRCRAKFIQLCIEFATALLQTEINKSHITKSEFRDCMVSFLRKTTKCWKKRFWSSSKKISAAMNALHALDRLRSRNEVHEHSLTLSIIAKWIIQFEWENHFVKHPLF